jgi:myotubularin-related protein 9
LVFLSQRFEALIEREWIQAGHPFATRNFRSCYSQSRDSPSTSLSVTNHGASVPAPTFLIFLDAVYQIHSQFLCSFQFTEDFLVLLFEHSYFSQFGNSSSVFQIFEMEEGSKPNSSHKDMTS